MASNINADTTTGLQLTSDTSGNINIQNNGTTVVAVTSSGVAVTGDLSVTGSVPGGFFTESVTFSTNTTVTSANAGKVYYTSTDDLTLTLPAPPGGTDTLTYGIINDSDTDLILKANNTSTEYIGDWLGSALLQSKQECIITSIGSNWKLIGASAASSINIVQFTSSGTYTPEATVSAFLVCMGGATAGASSPSSAAGGGGYSEKFYASPTGSYAVTLGAGGLAGGSAGGTTTFNGTDISITSSTLPNGGVASNGDWNVNGGNGGSTSVSRGGGGAGAGRAGIGGNGGNGSGAVSGGGGGTGGNNASGSTGGAAATAQNGSAYNLSALFTTFTFQAGDNGTGESAGGKGAAGHQAITLLDGTSSTLYGGNYGWWAVGVNGNPGLCTIVEFKG